VGNCYYGLGDKANAVKYYRYALNLNPSNASLSAFVSKIDAGSQASQPLANAANLYREKKFDDAVSAYQAAIAVDANNAKAYQGLGNAYYAAGEKGKARDAYQRSLELQPQNPALAAFMKSWEERSVAQASWVQPTWRSAILPGWGQFYNGEGTKGLVLGGLTLGLLAGTAATYVAGSAAQQEYLNAGPNADYDTPYSTWENMANLNHTLYVLMGASYLYTVVDAGLNAGKGSQQAFLGDRAPLQLAAAHGGFQIKARMLEF
jgi:tetratricopeptide (TPR) repeat protein